MKNIANQLIIIQNVIPGYRVVFFTYLKEVLGSRFLLYAGTDTYDNTIDPDKCFKPDLSLVNKFILGRRFMYYKGIHDLLRSPATLVFELNPRNLTVWFFLFYRKRLGLRTILWGHAWPRNGEDSNTDILRNLMRSTATSIITYTELQQLELKRKMPFTSVLSSSNALFRKQEMITSTNKNLIKDLIYVGRIIEDKKVILLYNAFKRSLPYLSKDINLKIIGSGPESILIKKKIQEDNLSLRVILLDAIFDNIDLKKHYEKCFFSVSPGYVGLNLIQSLGFGVPMIISEDEPHSPEIEAAVLNDNSIFFNSDSEEHLKEIILNVYNNREYWLEKRKVIISNCQNKYSIERMAQPFLELIND